ncbi:LLM class F420-dependent oxidoreductase [Dietzia maris]|uniref:TIGR03619 family F420-dependent LLM class oxidoreductase n=1 Tax=Dietzia cinnamea TaxID=321318 RepID=UPI0007BC1CDE|nr:TIGR03619 family F420-dependent LLM class oxidoreductase [Dietzia cinnamea]KZO59168.1 LLM class F420-dependent oxidoreductase [Dietzia maris]MCT2265459.1 TIGR03619 family F420-dependent LLM class oxidoreductase [Dietzia cinnamea]
MSRVADVEFSVPVSFSPVDQYLDIARGAEAAGIDRIVLPDSLFHPRRQDKDYPYTPDGSRMWDENTEWVEPLIACAAMGGATSRIRFCPQVLKVGPRNPLLLTRQVGSAALLTGNRLDLGVGIGWDPNEFEWCGAPFKGRGKRTDESLAILREGLRGQWMEFHGNHFDFDELIFTPAPSEQVPFYVGGHTEIALKRAARVGQGWTSAMMGFDDIVATVTRLGELLEEQGRSLTDRGDGKRFAIQVVCLDKFGTRGFTELAEAGVTDIIVMPWMIEGLGYDATAQQKIDALHRFGEKYGLTG